jgi:beta-lactamase class D
MLLETIMRKTVQSFIFLLSLIILFSAGVSAQHKENKVILPSTYKKHFYQYKVDGSLIIYELNAGRTYYYNEERTKKRFSPASTFKIFNSLVGLETGVIPDTSFVIPWDSVKRGNYLPWNRSNSLNTAFKFSVVWYYQELARRVGKERMQHFVSLNHYGNEDINETIDGFWLTDYRGKLRISQEEQISLLRKLYRNELNFSARSQKLVKDIMLMESNDEYKLFAKTGMCSEENLWYGWYVGWIETKGNVYFFATHVEDEGSENILSGARKGITFASLEELGIINHQKQ